MEENGFTWVERSLVEGGGLRWRGAVTQRSHVEGSGLGLEGGIAG